jgi:3-dehydroquinate dehydratase-2
MKVIIINGPNLNLLGVREKSIYGNISFEEYFSDLVEEFLDLELEHFQSNIEGELIDKLQEVGFSYDYILLNAGGYTHTSVAIADCVKAIETPVTEIHISNIYARENFRKKSLLSENCKAVICGLGMDSYKAALTILK